MCGVISSPTRLCNLSARAVFSLPHVSVHLMINERTTKSIYHTFVLLIHSIREFILYTSDNASDRSDASGGASPTLSGTGLPQLSNLKTHNTIYSIGHPTCHCHLLANQLRLLNPMQTKQNNTKQIKPMMLRIFVSSLAAELITSPVAELISSPAPELIPSPAPELVA